MTAAVNPFDPRTVFLAKHAQHVVLVHFPIALFIIGVVFDLAGRRFHRQTLRDAAYYNILVAAISALPVIASGLLAWQFQLEGQKLKGILLLHLIFAWISAILMWLTWLLHYRARGRQRPFPAYGIAMEVLTVAIVGLTSHLGGFLSGVIGVN